ncbi:MAG TPA: hypothetical protein VK923_10670 [Euzebyales bacterium]|nr:hypothetical protein [Euzebyales bacterium]
MADVGLGLVAILVGAGLTASLTGEGFLATVLGWLVGLVVAALFGVLAYLYYEVSVLIAMSAIGFSWAPPRWSPWASRGPGSSCWSA